ncbi:MAG: ABC transporter substrate-binding protein [Anaerolineae bacterium]
MKRPQISEKQMEKVHPYIPEVYKQLREGRISRREFMRTVTLLGMSFGAATIAAQCGAQPAAPAAEQAAPAEQEQAAPAQEQEAAPAQEQAAEAAPTGGIKRGGTLRIAEQMQAIDHPARLSWTEPSNVFRFVFEYLTETDRENITHPYLLEKWEASDDLQTWTLHVRKGIMWTNGDELNADDVIFNFNEWLNPDVGSSILGFFEGFMTANDIERVDDHTVRLHMAAPKLDVPENLFHYPAQIMHRSFDGDVTTGKNPSTGPYTLEEYVVGERARVVARDDYWQMGEDGQPLPYLDAIEWIDLGDDQTAYVAALQSGEVHSFYDPTVDSFLALRGDPNVNIIGVATSQVRVMRMRVDQPPYDDVRVRNALKMCQDREKILDLAYFSEGVLGHDVHVAPIHPEFAPMEVPAYDPDGAKALLEEAGFADGIDMSISVGTGWTDVVAYAETLKEDAAPAGINLTLDTMPNPAYWDLWTETPLGITPWTHRPLAVMVLPLAYIADSEGNPVPWNETRWVDEEFSARLLEAQGTLDIEARRAIMADVQRIMQERGPVGIAFWKNVWTVINPAFQNIKGHPNNYELYREVWYDPELDPHA